MIKLKIQFEHHIVINRYFSFVCYRLDLVEKWNRNNPGQWKSTIKVATCLELVFAQEISSEIRVLMAIILNGVKTTMEST